MIFESGIMIARSADFELYKSMIFGKIIRSCGRKSAGFSGGIARFSVV